MCCAQKAAARVEELKAELHRRGWSNSVEALEATGADAARLLPALEAVAEIARDERFLTPEQAIEDLREARANGTAPLIGPDGPHGPNGDGGDGLGDPFADMVNARRIQERHALRGARG